MNPNLPLISVVTCKAEGNPFTYCKCSYFRGCWGFGWARGLSPKVIYLGGHFEHSQVPDQQDWQMSIVILKSGAALISLDFLWIFHTLQRCLILGKLLSLQWLSCLLPNDCFKSLCFCFVCLFCFFGVGVMIYQLLCYCLITGHDRCATSPVMLEGQLQTHPPC